MTRSFRSSTIHSLNLPRHQSLQSLANADPLKWAQMVKILAALSGYADRKQHTHDHTHLIHNLTDAQVEDAIHRIESGEIIDITEFASVSSAPSPA